MAMVFEKETNLYQNGAIASKFRTQDTQFQVINGKIAYLITDQEIEHYEDGSGTIASRMNTAESTIEGNTSLISELRTDYNALTGEIEGYESSTNEFKQTTNQTISTITQTVSTKTRTFNSQPTPPYSVNDLWFKSKELYICTYSKSTGQSYSASDWTLATKYTDDAALTTFIQSTYAGDMSNLQTQVDGKIETWNQPGDQDPSTTWTTSAVREKHTGDLWYNTTNGTTWRYTGSAWVEQNIPTSVLANINGKAKIFIAEPYTPYSEGDLWVQGETGDILKCVNPRSTGRFDTSDWRKASKYTDDTALTTFVGNVYNPKIQSIESTIDGKIDTWFYAYAPTLNNVPAKNWDSDNVKNSHLDDIFYNTATGYCYRFIKSNNTYSWERIKDSDITSAMSAASQAQDTADGKRQVFTTQPTKEDAYDVGDLWVNATYSSTYSNDLLKCKQKKVKGANFNINHWEKASKYTDDTALNTWKGNTSYITFQSFIDQLPNQINLQVTGSGTTTAGEKFAAKASIIAEINASQEESAIKINANRVNIDGNTAITAINNGDGTVRINADKIVLESYATQAYANKIKGKTLYGTCSTGASTATKVVDCSDAVELYAGLTITVKFTYTNTADAPTLNVKNLGAKPISIGGADAGSSNQFLWAAGTSIEFTYDGSSWVANGHPKSYYGSSSTAKGTATKVSTVDQIVICKGASVQVQMLYENTAANPKINISGIGARDIYANNAAVAADSKYNWAANTTIVLIFDGSRWQMGSTADAQKAIAAQATADGAVARITVAEGQITSKVEKGSIISTINQSSEAVTIKANKLNLTGYITATNLSTSGQTTINGGNITTGIIKDANQNVIFNLNTGSLTMKSGSINLGNGKFAVNTAGELSVSGGASITGIFTSTRDSSTKVIIDSARFDGYVGSTKYGSLDLIAAFPNNERRVTLTANGSNMGIYVGSDKALWIYDNTGSSATQIAEFKKSGITFNRAVTFSVSPSFSSISASGNISSSGNISASGTISSTGNISATGTYSNISAGSSGTLSGGYLSISKTSTFTGEAKFNGKISNGTSSGYPLICDTSFGRPYLQRFTYGGTDYLAFVVGNKWYCVPYMLLTT